MNQQQALDILKLGHNVYLTGSAGSGKTYLLNKYISYLQGQGVAIGITASTGIAATHLKGITVHSWSGLGIKDSLAEKDWRILGRKRQLNKRLNQSRVLIIDEISMLPAYYLDLVDAACRVFRKNEVPFGGLQVILCGDFFQLPPIGKIGEEAKFAFAAAVWPKLNLKICYLDEQHRHQDNRLVEILNGIRENNLSDQALNNLNSRYVQAAAAAPALTRLYTHNADVDAINNRQLQSLPGKTYCYSMKSNGRQPLVDGLKNSCLAPGKLCLKKNALVMFVKNNFEQGYTNGTLGKVIDFDEAGLPIVETVSGRRITALPASWQIDDDGWIKAEIIQIPLRLAWAITVHKSQGMGLDAAEIDLSKSFEAGMGYVALSRVRTLEGIKLIGLNDLALLVNEEVCEFDRQLKQLSNTAAEELKEIDDLKLNQQQQLFLKSIIPKEQPKKVRRKIIPGATYQETKNLLSKKLPIAEMAKLRCLTEGTIMSHLEKLSRRGEKLDLEYLKPPAERLAEIKSAFARSDGFSLSPVREILGESFSYDELRLARLFLEKE